MVKGMGGEMGFQRNGGNEAADQAGGGAGGAMVEGIRTATTWPRAQISPAADTVAATITFRSLISWIRPRISRGTPSGVGRR